MAKEGRTECCFEDMTAEYFLFIKVRIKNTSIKYYKAYLFFLKVHFLLI